MNELERINKNLKIKASQLETKKRRRNQSCSVYKVKIDDSSLNRKQREALKMIFVESKWIYNDLLNHLQQNKDLNSYDVKRKSVLVKDKNKNFIQRDLRFIGSQMKQSIVSQVKSSLKTLKSLKLRNIQKSGKLKYISEYKSINLKQYKQTYDIKSQSKIRIQNIPGSVRVNGLKQFQDLDNIEFANAKILNTKSGYYIAITIYREKIDEDREYLDEIGIDFGIKTSITTSTGSKYNVLIEESERIKKLQRSLSRKQKRSNNQYKVRLKLNKAYEKLSNRKNDQANKLVHELLKHKKVYMQDEQLHNWHQTKFCSKKVQHSILGRVKNKLMHHERVVVIKKNVATTQYCPNCRTKNKLELNQRTYVCSCGYSLDRDVHAALNMIILAQDSKNIKVRREPTEFTLAEIRKESLKQEDRGFQAVISSPDFCLSSIEIGRRGFEFSTQFLRKRRERKRTVVCPDFDKVKKSVRESMEEISSDVPLLNSWTDVFNALKNSRLKYRVPLSDVLTSVSPYSESLSMKSIKRLCMFQYFIE